MLVNMGVKYENVHYLDISYDQIRNPEIMRKGAIVLPTNTVSKYFPRTQTSLLSSFGLFPEVNLNHFSLEYRVRFSEKPLLIGQMYAGIYNKSDLAIEVPLSDSAFAMYDYFHFKQHIPIEKAKIPEVFVVPRNDRWNTVRMDVNNRHCDVYINNKLNYSTPVPVLTDSLLWGLEMQFASETELDYIRFTDPQGKLLYAQEFNDPETMNLLEPGKLVYQKLCGAKAKP